MWPRESVAETSKLTDWPTVTGLGFAVAESIVTASTGLTVTVTVLVAPVHVAVSVIVWVPTVRAFVENDGTVELDSTLVPSAHW